MRTRIVASEKKNTVLSHSDAAPRARIDSESIKRVEKRGGPGARAASVFATRFLLLAVTALSFSVVPIEAPAEMPLASRVTEISVDPGFLPNARLEPLEDLLILADRRDRRSLAEQCDDSLAAAVARGSGSDHDLQPAKRFKKRSRDLFRTEREIAIGEREMLLRLRLRAKRRRAMSVELRF